MNKIDNYVILFADLIGSTEVAVETSPSFFAQTYIASYHWAARKAYKFVMAKEIFPKDQFFRKFEYFRITGDESLIFSPLIDNNKIEDVVASTIAFAYVLKLYWLVSPYNLFRILNKQFPRDIAVGVHIGPATLVPNSEENDKEHTNIASLHINVTKKIENQARQGNGSRIFASSDVVDKYKRWLKQQKNIPLKNRAPLAFTDFFQLTDLSFVKGVPKKLQLFELGWIENNNKLKKMLSQLKSPKNDDIDAEDAAKFFAIEFFGNLNKPFTYDNNIEAIDYSILGIHDTQTYIERWFEAMIAPNRLFFNEYWLVLSSYIISCALLSMVSQDKQNICRGTADEIFKRLEELYNAKKIIREK